MWYTVTKSLVYSKEMIKFGLSQSLLPIVTTLKTKLLLEKYLVPPCPTDHVGRDTEYSVKNWTRNLGRSSLTLDSPKPQEARTPSFPCLAESNTLFRLLQDLHPRSCSDISYLEPVENPIRTLTWKEILFVHSPRPFQPCSCRVVTVTIKLD